MHSEIIHYVISTSNISLTAKSVIICVHLPFQVGIQQDQGAVLSIINIHNQCT
jgi:hypothetical protein